MKKHLLAIAIASSMPLVAAAQNVSMYGQIDAGIINTDTDGGAKTTSGSNSVLSTSVMGFRGSEDLGGGLKAEFQLEGAVNYTNGDVGATFATNGDTATAALFSREAWVGITGGFGSVRIGRTDVTSAQGVDTVANLGNLNDFITDLGSDQSSVIRYTTPVINGFQAQVGYANSASATAKGTTDVTSGYLQYVEGPLAVRLGVTTAEVASADDNKQTALSVAYDAGVARVAVASNRIDSATSTTDARESHGYVSVPLGQGLTAHASYGKHTPNSGSSRTLMGLGVVKDLSKRTNAYVAYMGTEYKHTTADKAEIAIGLRHAF